MLLSAGIAAQAQGIAKEEGEAIASYLQLNASQKQKVIKLFTAEEKKFKQERDNKAAAKRLSPKDVDARKKAAAKPKSHASSKPKVKHGGVKARTTPTDRLVRIAYGKAQRHPSIQKEMKGILTPAQFAKWNQLGK